MKKIGFLFFSCFALSARAGLPEVKEIKLDNGLKVLLAPSPRVPALTMFTFFKVGSRNERPGITGVSHFMEHMMFNGAVKYGPKQFDLTMERAGGTNNAFTSNDMTAYNDDIPAAFLDTCVDMEVDRLKDIAMDAKLFDSERHVVMEERRLRSEDDPDGAMDEALSAAAFKASPYHWPVVGWMKDLEAITRDEGYRYIKTYYAPNNATLILSGDFNLEATEKLIRARYSEVPAQPQPAQPVNAEPEQMGPIRVELRKAVEAPALLRGYKAPAVKDPDAPALDLLAEILGGGEQAVLTQALVQDGQLATDVTVYSPGLLEPSLFAILVHLRPGTDTAKARALLDDTLAKFTATGAGAADAQLKRAQARIAVKYLQQLETNNGFASALGQADVLHGDWREAFKYKGKIDAVTLVDLNRVSKKYLVDKSMTEVTLKPTEAEAEPVAVPVPVPVKKAK